MKQRKRRGPLTTEGLSKRLAGRMISELSQESPSAMALRFTDGGALILEVAGEAIRATLQVAPPAAEEASSGARPTRRQLEYLEFIKRYMHRRGISPSEADIQEYFMVSAPSVNQMVRTLERRGFITRERGWFGQTVPRSIRVTWGG